MYKTYTKQICKESNILLKKTDPLLFVRREEGGGGWPTARAEGRVCAGTSAPLARCAFTGASVYVLLEAT